MNPCDLCRREVNRSRASRTICDGCAYGIGYMLHERYRRSGTTLPVLTLGDAIERAGHGR